MPTADLDDTELWFLDRGIPHFIEDYDSDTRVWTRSLRFLVATYALAAVPTSFATTQSALFEFGIAVTCLLGTWMVSNLLRGRPVLSWPTQVGPVELGAYVVGPTLPHVLRGEWLTALLVAVALLVLLGLTYVVTSYGLIPLLTWTLRRSARTVAAVGPATARAIPVLLLVVTFFFMTTEVWQVFARLRGLPYGLSLMMFLVAGAAFVANRARGELSSLQAMSSWDEVREAAGDAPVAAGAAAGASDLKSGDVPALDLSRRQRINLTMVVVINQVLLAMAVATGIGLFFLIFGFLVISDEVISTWVLHPSNPLLTLHLPFTGRRLILSEELVRVSGFLAVFSGFYFGVYSSTDTLLREGLSEFAEDNLRQVLAVRKLYLAGRAAGVAGAGDTPTPPID